MIKFLKNIFSLRGFPYLVFIVGGVALYYRSFFFGFTYLDDHAWILDHQWYLKDIHNLYRVFFSPDLITQIFYRPLLNLSFLINAHLGGVEPFIYHTTNVGFHIINAALVFSFFQKMDYERDVSFGVAAVFLIHPVLTTAVSWIPGRTDSLLGTFILLSFIAFLDFAKERRKKDLICHCVFFLFALWIKETAIMLPFLAVSYLIFIRKEPWKNITTLIPGWVIILLSWLSLRAYALRGVERVGIEEVLRSLEMNSVAVISYFGKVFFPFNLSVLPVLEDISLGWGIVAIFSVCILFILSRKKRVSYIIFGLLWFMLFLIPSLVLSFLKHEYRLYIPIIGCFILLLEIDLLKNIKNRKTATFFLGVILIFSMINLQYQGCFKDRMSFWKSAVKTSPHSPLAHRNLGAMYYLDAVKLDDNDIEKKELFHKALASYQEALSLNPLEVMAHNNIGLIQSFLGKDIEAEAEFKREIAVNPYYPNVYFNLGLLYYRQGKFDLAVSMLHKALELDPKFIESYRYLSIFYYNKNDLVTAKTYYQELKKRGVMDDALERVLEGP